MAEPPIEGSLAPLKHVMRRQLLRCLNESEDLRPPAGLAEQIQKNLGAVSYHLRALKGAGMAKLVTRKPKRGPVESLYGSAVKDNTAVNKVLEETAAADEQLLPRNPS